MLVIGRWTASPAGSPRAAPGRKRRRTYFRCIPNGPLWRNSVSVWTDPYRCGYGALTSRELARRQQWRRSVVSEDLRDRAALVADVVDQDVLAQAIGAGEERAALVDAGQLLDELRQHPALLEHERVDRDPLARAALDFLQRLLERAPRRGIGKVGFEALHVGGRLAFGDHDDLLVAALLPPQELAGELEAVMHVGADVPLAPRELRKVFGLELFRVEGEPEDVQAVARELAADQRGQRERDLLGRQEVTVVDHRAAHVEHHDRRGLGRELGPDHLEIVRREPHRRAGAVALDRVHQRLLEVEQEGIAELVALGLVGGITARAPALDVVPPEAVALEGREDVLERLVAELADRARGELEPVALALEVARLLQLLRELLQPLEVLRRLLAEQLLDVDRIDLVQIVRRLDAAQLALELLHPLELVH